jgi:hypothetical protein
MDGHGETSIPPYNFGAGGGIIKGTEVISVKIVYIVHIMDYVSQVSIVAHGLLFIEVADNNLL